MGNVLVSPFTFGEEFNGFLCLMTTKKNEKVMRKKRKEILIPTSRFHAHDFGRTTNDSNPLVDSAGVVGSVSFECLQFFIQDLLRFWTFQRNVLGA
jgi:hypothetical protein